MSVIAIKRGWLDGDLTEQLRTACYRAVSSDFEKQNLASMFAADGGTDLQETAKQILSLFWRSPLPQTFESILKERCAVWLDPVGEDAPGLQFCLPKVQPKMGPTDTALFSSLILHRTQPMAVPPASRLAIEFRMVSAINPPGRQENEAEGIYSVLTSDGGPAVCRYRDLLTFH